MRTAMLNTAPGSAPIIAVLDYPLKAALKTHRQVITSMILVLAAALIAGVFGAVLIARGVSRPIEALAASARRIAKGDYSAPPAPTPRGEIGELASALGNMTDAIAEREAALRRTVGALEVARDEAVRANSAKSQFLANMSHELRTPLNAILGFSDMMTNEVMGPIGNPRYASYLRDIHDSGKHLLDLVEEMLDLARAEVGSLSIDSQSLRVGEIVAACAAAFSDRAAKAGVVLSGPADPASWPSLKGDEKKLTQAIANLIDNAIKFTPSGGHVLISGETLQEAFVIRVRDTGIGMSPDAIDVVVKPFQRQAGAFDGKYQGAGLGLPFAKAIVELHGGRLDLTSAIGAGTTVSVVLPLAAASASQRMTSAA
jgi:signal transduction histidine kinase